LGSGIGFFPFLFFGVVLLFYPLVNAILLKTPFPAELIRGDAALLGELVKLLVFEPQVLRDFGNGHECDWHLTDLAFLYLLFFIRLNVIPE